MAIKNVALITGASSGMGIHYAEQLFALGYNVLLVSNQQKELEEVAKKIMDNNPDEVAAGRFADPFYMDLSKRSAAEECMAYCNGKGYEVEILINNAGVYFFKDLLDCSQSQVDLILNLHIYTVTAMCRLFGEEMRRRRHGYILNVSSISTNTPFAAISLYSATKAYIRNLTKALRLEMYEYGVRVMVVTPGAVATDLYNLDHKLQDLGVHLGFIIRPKTLVRRTLRHLLRRRCREYIPGIASYFYKPVYNSFPLGFKLWVRKKTASMRNK